VKDLKKRIIGITIMIVCSLPSLWTARGSEVISPVPVSDKSVGVKKFTERRDGKGERYYFYCLQTVIIQSKPLLYSGVIKADKDETPDQVFKRVLMSNEKSLQRCVVIIQFSKLE